MTTTDPYLDRIIELTAERQILYARKCSQEGDRQRLSAINDELELKQRQRNIWRAGGNPDAITGPLPLTTQDQRSGPRHWRSRQNQ